MVSVPANTYVASTIPASNNAMYADPYQFTGASFNFQAGTCPQPYGNATDITFCSALCINSCPNLNPDPRAASQTIINQLQAQVSFIGPALDAASAALALQTAPVTVTGAVSFPTGSAPVSVIQATASLMQSSLPANFPYPLTLSVIPHACARFWSDH